MRHIWSGSRHSIPRRMLEAAVTDADGESLRVVKVAAYAVVIGLARASPRAAAAADTLEQRGMQSIGGRGRTASGDATGRAYCPQQPVSHGRGFPGGGTTYNGNAYRDGD